MMAASLKQVIKIHLLLVLIHFSTCSARWPRRTIADLDGNEEKHSFFHGLDHEDWSDTLETELDNAQWRREHPIFEPKSKREAPVAEAVKAVDHVEDDEKVECSPPKASRVVGMAPTRKKRLLIPPKFSRSS